MLECVVINVTAFLSVSYLSISVTRLTSCRNPSSVAPSVLSVYSEIPESSSCTLYILSIDSSVPSFLNSRNMPISSTMLLASSLGERPSFTSLYFLIISATRISSFSIFVLRFALSPSAFLSSSIASSTSAIDLAISFAMAFSFSTVWSPMPSRSLSMRVIASSSLGFTSTLRYASTSLISLR